jgi:hypothetical protein
MGRLRFGQWASVVITISLFLLFPACGGSKPPGASPFPTKITLNPAPSYSMQLGTVILFTASAQNSADSNIRPPFTFFSSAPGILDIAPNGLACAGSWNAPYYSVCTPAGSGEVQVTASALGSTSPPTMVFVHPFISSIQVSLVPPVNSPPPACPAQIALPAACDLPFRATNSCLSQNQLQTLQATAYDNEGNDITAYVGPFSWTQSHAGVSTLTPIVTSSVYNVPTNQATATPSAPGQTQVIASASGVYSQPYNFETCPVQCIAMELNVNGLQRSGETSFVVTKGSSEAITVTATAVDVQGCIVPKPPLTWLSSEPAAIAAGSATTGCASGTTTCTIAITQPGVAAITATCTPPTCNIGFPLNLAAVPAPYIPEPVYPVTAISGLVTGATTATGVLATSQDCYSNILCTVGIYNVSTSTNLPGGAIPLPAPPNSLMFDPAGDKAYMGSEFGAAAVNPANFTGSSSPFTLLPAPGTTLGLVTGEILAVSHNGSTAIFSDTVSTPNQVYVVSSSPSSTTPLNINSATAAAFSPDGLEAFILGNGGNTLYIYSTLQYLQPPISLPAPATSIVFNSTGAFALLSGGSAAGTLAVYNTCDNSSVSLPAPGLPAPPIFLTMVPAGNVPMGTPLIPSLQTEGLGLDFFFGVDNTGIDIIATNAAAGPLTALCPQLITLAQIQPQTTPPTFFPPVHINIGEGTFQPINFFLSPDATRAYIVTSDLGVLAYNFDTSSTSRIPLVNNATPVAAGMTVDGSLIYVAGSDGLLHQVNTALALDEYQVSFTPLVNSSNSFCYTGSNCALNIIGVKP